MSGTWAALLWGPLGADPSQLAALFLHFLILSLLAVGGAIATAPDMHRVMVDQRGWLSDTQFTASIALAQAAPGPNVLFVAVLGWQVAGLSGVLATLGGNLLPSTTLALAANRWGEQPRSARLMQALKTGLSPLTLGLLLATGWILLEPVVWRAGAAWPGAWLLAAATVALALRSRLSPLWPIAAGAVAGALGWV